ncbi:MAG: hypothetical protein EXR78_02125 [Deltaproteobacteria bacterium]|nr:hypothetical protein [Deltaproteobacteria bacterium]
MLQGKLRRLMPVLLAGLMLSVGGGYAWTFTPSYSLYCLKQALETHDYQMFSQYVDVDSVLDHALDEFGNSDSGEEEKPRLKGFLGKLARKGFFKFLAGDAREVTKAGLSIAVEQAVKDRDRPLPRIPLLAVPAALWLGRSEGELVVFPVKLKKEQLVEVKMRRTSPEPWRVVEVTNLKALLPALQRKLAKPDGEQSDNP